LLKTSELDIHPSQRKQKNYTFLEVTRSLCPTCEKPIDAKLLLKNDQIIMTKWCPEHGHFKCLIHSDAAWYFEAQKYHRPGDIPLKYSSEMKLGCPYDCGVCPDHEQHICLGLLDITENCNMNCPTCFAASGKGGKHMSMEDIEGCLDRFVELEGPGGVIQLSGGEPTTHPQFLDIVKLALTKPYDIVMINTNGLILAKDTELVKQLAEIGENRLEIYLQFDSLESKAYEILRGEDLLAEKHLALQNCLDVGLPVNLIATVARGVNEDQVGPLVELGIKTKGIRGVNFQPVSYAGRHSKFDPMDRMTLTEVMHGIETQTEGTFKVSDFLPLPCSHPSQIAMTYAYTKNGKVKPIPRYIDLKPYMDYFTNTVYPDPRPIFLDAVKGLWSAGTSMSSAKTLYDFSCVCGMPVKKDFFTSKGRAKIADEDAFRIVILQFQDVWNWDMKIAKKCCVGFIQPDGRIIPFDTHNIFYRENGGSLGHNSENQSSSPEDMGGSGSKTEPELTEVSGSNLG